MNTCLNLLVVLSVCALPCLVNINQLKSADEGTIEQTKILAPIKTPIQSPTDKSKIFHLSWNQVIAITLGIIVTFAFTIGILMWKLHLCIETSKAIDYIKLWDRYLTKLSINP